MCYKHTRTHTRLLKLEFSEAAVTSQLISFVFFLCLRFFFFFSFYNAPLICVVGAPTLSLAYYRCYFLVESF